MKMLDEIYSTVEDVYLRQYLLYGSTPMPLTEAEKFAIAFVAGAKIKYKRPNVDWSNLDDWTKNLTAEHCEISWDGHKFLVVDMSAA